MVRLAAQDQGEDEQVLEGGKKKKKREGVKKTRKKEKKKEKKKREVDTRHSNNCYFITLIPSLLFHVTPYICFTLNLHTSLTSVLYCRVAGVYTQGSESTL